MVQAQWQQYLDSKTLSLLKYVKKASINGVVEAVNFNSPGQVVIAGEKNALDHACELMKEAGAKRALVLPVSVPSALFFNERCCCKI